MPTRFPVAKGVVRLCGLVADLDPESGRCLSIERVNRLIDPQGGADNGSEGES